ncbi:MAG TPA: hypothetical protein VET65_11940, partial [Candidatus Limnocylindrales bacterium]|nr:hypothetical protein [Candidatus Limnocylindrales bacterium]
APGADGADGQFLILLRAADHEPAARALRLRVDALTRVVANMIVFPDRELRAELVASMVLGVVVQRSLLRRLPLKGVRADQLAPCFMAITELLYRR